MKKKSPSQSAFFNPRVLLAFTLCSVGALLAMLSLAATPPVETPRANTSVRLDPANFLSAVGNNANRLPPGVPVPPGAQFSLNRQGAPSSSRPTARFPGFAGMPLRPGRASGANSLGSPGFASQQPAPLSVPQPAASESMPLASGAQSDEWSIVSSPNPSATENYLYGVTCASASDCWAVGGYFDNSIQTYQTLIELWDGTSWAIVNSPNPSGTLTFLNGVTCASASDCWAVGDYFDNSSDYRTLIERWDGTSWAIVSSPNPTAAGNFLKGVTCASASDCWAVGFYVQTEPLAYRTLIERWDGTSWTIVNSPNPGDTDTLEGVTCASASNCWAVGAYQQGNSVVQTLIELWDGTSWAIVNSPGVTAQNNVLNGVTCASASDCWAVGYSFSLDFTTLKTLIERWDGTSWAIVSSPNPSPTWNLLFGVTCVSASDCWAVGHDYSDAGIFQTLMLRYTASPTPTPTPTPTSTSTPSATPTASPTPRPTPTPRRRPTPHLRPTP
jgi:hypothetical protein